MATALVIPKGVENKLIDNARLTARVRCVSGSVEAWPSLEAAVREAIVLLVGVKARRETPSG